MFSFSFAKETRVFFKNKGGTILVQDSMVRYVNKKTIHKGRFEAKGVVSRPFPCMFPILSRN